MANFYALVQMWQSRNMIMFLIDTSGRRVKEPKKVQSLLVNQFRELFEGQQRTSVLDSNFFTRGLKVSSARQQYLCHMVTDDKIKAAMYGSSHCSLGLKEMEIEERPGIYQACCLCDHYISYLDGQEPSADGVPTIIG
ncbi:hypothetical protein Ancab_001822 [Ancistrocladus abbreviatus]